MAREIKRKCVVCGEKFGTSFINVKWCSSDCGYEHSMRIKEKRQAAEQKEKKKALKESIKTMTDYRNDLQEVVNKLVRTIDYGQCCISCGNLTTLEAGHYFHKSKTSARACTFHLWNLHGQCKYCNRNQHGSLHDYRKGIERIYGHGIFGIIEILPEMYNDLTFDKDELKTATETAKQIFKSLEKGKIYSTDERIELRKTINHKLKLYLI